MTQLHRWIPISLAYDEPETPTTWRCAGCSATTGDPSPRLDEACAALALEGMS